MRNIVLNKGEWTKGLRVAPCPLLARSGRSQISGFQPGVLEFALCATAGCVGCFSTSANVGKRSKSSNDLAAKGQLNSPPTAYDQLSLRNFRVACRGIDIPLVCECVKAQIPQQRS